MITASDFSRLATAPLEPGIPLNDDTAAARGCCRTGMTLLNRARFES